MGPWGYPRFSTLSLCSPQFTRLDFKKVAENINVIFLIFFRDPNRVSKVKKQKDVFCMITENIYFVVIPRRPFFYDSYDAVALFVICLGVRVLVIRRLTPIKSNNLKNHITN